MRAEPGEVLDAQVWHRSALAVISVLQNKHGSWYKISSEVQVKENQKYKETVYGMGRI